MGNQDLKNTKTEINLMKAFTGESQARNRYTIFASVAKKDGMEQIAAIFQETADNEKEHAKIYYNHMQNGPIEFCATMPYCLGSTYDNLMCAASGEHEEWTTLYPSFADVAEEEGFYEIATSFRNIASVEKHHDSRFKKLAQNIVNYDVFKKGSEVFWKCRNCGYIHSGASAPLFCPTCNHPKAYFEVLCDNF